ncbi:MAG: polyprenyl synthetase family protein [Puniceicoccales bacterium]|jgi:octaprenyl-diphosphate synthase|nr:polyprenyl synthetase family protein [Puniceicoccales bacterium]
MLPDPTISDIPASIRDSTVLFAPIREHLRLLDEFLDAQVVEFEPAVRSLVSYTLAHRGKRLRPALVFYAGWTGTPPAQPLVRAAAIIELVHLATLIHDDILDEADLRHNSRTIVAQHGQHPAVLLGDAFFAQALILASEFPTTEVCRHVSTATRQVCSGEICQTFDRGNVHLTLEQYYRIIRLKTAELFEVSCRLGATLAFDDVAYADACAIYGRHLGIAYQIFDDITDLIGSEAGFGKTLGTDFSSGKFTLPALLYFGQLGVEDFAQLTEALEHHLIAPDELVQRMLAVDIPQRCAEIFHAELDKALAAIVSFKNVPATKRLGELAGFIRAQLDALHFPAS